MQRWFYANEEVVCVHAPSTGTSSPKGEETLNLRAWRFCVQINDRELMPNEALALSGNCEQLGDWKFEKCILMSPLIDGCQDKWHVYIDIPADKVISYRYLIVAIDPEGDQMIVRFFESHLKPRKIHPQSECIANSCEDVFGAVKNSVKVERGWLTTERIVQLMFFNAPFKWRDSNLATHVMQVKVTPAYRREISPCPQRDEYTAKIYDSNFEIDDTEVFGTEATDTTKKPKIKIPFKCGQKIPSYTKLTLEDCKEMFATDTLSYTTDKKFSVVSKTGETLAKKSNITLSTAFAFNEVVNFNQKKDTLKRQPEFGTPCGEHDLTLFHLTIGDFDNTVYLIEFFMYSKNAGPDENPYLIGYRYLLPEDFEAASSGFIEAPVISASTHRLLGKMYFRFLVIRPAEDLKFDLSISYIRHWNSKQATLDVGHRGQGGSYQTSEGKFIYENTIHSIKTAISNGADMVEFDVQLTKDAVPVIYHDFNVKVSQFVPNLLQNDNSIKLPLNKLTLKELRNLRFPNNVASPSPLALDYRISDATAQGQLFPLLGDIMDAVDEDIAFDIEIKWPQQYCNGKWEQDVKPRFDRNLFIDRILQAIMAKAGNRRIVLCCFEADMCSMLRFKQNLFPVMFLLPQECVVPYMDARSNSCSIAINFAYGMELLGVIPHAHTLIRCPMIIGESLDLQLVIFCYGVVGNEDTSLLRNIGVSAVILDRIDKLDKQDDCNCPCCPKPNAEESGAIVGSDSISFKSVVSWEEN